MFKLFNGVWCQIMLSFVVIISSLPGPHLRPMMGTRSPVLLMLVVPVEPLRLAHDKSSKDVR